MFMAVLEMSAIENSTTTTNFSTTFAVETTTLLNNLTNVLTNLTSGDDHLISNGSGNSNATGILGQPMLPEDDDIHKNPELKYFSTVIIIFMGLTILIVPVFCFIGVVCARARIFKTVREAAGRGWGFGDLNVPYAEFGSAEDYSKSDIASVPSSSTGGVNCDVNILVGDGSRAAASSSISGRRSSFLRVLDDEDEDISSSSPTFVRNPA